MLLETLKSLVARSKKYKQQNLQVPPLPSSIHKPKSTTIDLPHIVPLDNNYTNTRTGDTQDLGTDPPHDEPLVPAGSIFPNAQDCVFNNLTLLTQTFNFSGTVLQLLAQRSIPGVEVDSSAREDPPHCHPDTRKALRRRMTEWVAGLNRHWRMLWALGPMGVGKSAIAQTIAEELNDSGQLGAAIFFSRPNHRDDPDGVIPTLAYQLADKFPEYKRIVTQRLADSVAILDKNRRTQFKELIIEPIRTLMTQRARAVRQPLVIILDGLDECRSSRAQCEFIELISDHVRQVEEFPLLWMIFSRPEWHLKSLLSQPDFQVTCQREDILIDDPEAQRDVGRALEANFRLIQRKYHDRLEMSWPPREHVRRISAISSGHFAFATAIIRFVGDEHRADPRSQLDLCIRFLGGAGLPGAVNPLHALDLLYHQNLSDIPADIIPVTMRILGLSILYPDTSLTAYIQTNFLCLDQAAFYRSLQKLHSVISVPAAAEAHRVPLRFYHASFTDYLSDPLRSGRFSVNKSKVHFEAGVQAIKWQRRPPKDKPMEQGSSVLSHPRLRWVHDEMQVGETISSLRDYSSLVGWKACCHVSAEDVPNLVAELATFDFKTIRGQPRSFEDFLAWLFKLGDQNNTLISMWTPDNPTVQNTETLSIVHNPNDMRGYLSCFGLHRGAELGGIKSNQLQLRLGLLENCREIKITVLSDRAHSSSYTCHFCEDTFTSRQNLQNHMNSHLARNPFQCQYCSKQYRHLRSLNRHLAKAHHAGPWG